MIPASACASATSNGDQFCEVVEDAAAVIFMQALVGRHVILDGRNEKIIDAGEERTDDKGYRVIRVELAGGRVCDLPAPVATLGLSAGLDDHEARLRLRAPAWAPRLPTVR